MNGKQLKAWAQTVPDEAVIEYSPGSYWHELTLGQLRAVLPMTDVGKVEQAEATG